MSVKDYSDEELLSMSDEDFARLEAQPPSRREEKDRLLGIGPDLNAPLRYLSPIEEDLTPTTSHVKHWDEVERTVANAALNAGSLPFEYTQAANSPLDTGGDFLSTLMGAVKKQYGPATRSINRYDDTDTDVAAWNALKGGLKAQFTDWDQFKRRPLDPFLTLASILVPALRTKGMIAPRMAKSAKFVEDIGAGVVHEGLRQTGNLIGRAKEKLPDRPRFLNRDNLGEAVTQFLGRTTTTGGRVQRIIAEAPQDVTGAEGRIIREFSGRPENPDTRHLPTDERILIANNAVLKNAAEGVDRIKADVDKFQRESRAGMKEGLWKENVRPDLLENLKRETSNIVRELNVKIKDEFGVEVLEPKLEQIPSQRSTTPSAMFGGARDVNTENLPFGTKIKEGATGKEDVSIRGRTGEASLEYPAFPERNPSPITSRGVGQDLLQDFYGRLVNADKAQVGGLQNFLYEIDAAIKVTDNDLGKYVNLALSQMRKRMRETLTEQFGGKDLDQTAFDPAQPHKYNPSLNQYDELTYAYERDIIALHAQQMHLGLEPGMLDSRGGLGDINAPEVLKRILSGMDDSDGYAYAALRELETKGGAANIQQQLAGVATQPWFGSSLMQQAEVHKQARSVGRAVAALPKNAIGAAGMGMVGATALVYHPIYAGLGILASTVFSPQGMQRFMLDMNPKIKPKFERTFAAARSVMERAASAGRPVSKWIQQGLTIEQVLNRLAEADESQRQRQQERSSNSTLTTLGGITPPVR